MSMSMQTWLANENARELGKVGRTKNDWEKSKSLRFYASENNKKKRKFLTRLAANLLWCWDWRVCQPQTQSQHSRRYRRQAVPGYPLPNPPSQNSNK